MILLLRRSSSNCNCVNLPNTVTSEMPRLLTSSRLTFPKSSVVSSPSGFWMTLRIAVSIAAFTFGSFGMTLDLFPHPTTNKAITIGISTFISERILPHHPDSEKFSGFSLQSHCSPNFPENTQIH